MSYRGLISHSAIAEETERLATLYMQVRGWKDETPTAFVETLIEVEKEINEFLKNYKF